MTQSTQSKTVSSIAHTLFWGGATISLLALVQRALPEATLKALPWKLAQSPALGGRIMRGSIPATAIGLSILASRRWSHHPPIKHPEHPEHPVTGSPAEGEHKDVVQQAAHQKVLSAIRARCPSDNVNRKLPQFCEYSMSLTPSLAAGARRWLAGRQFWKEWQCEVAMDQYASALFKEIAGWEGSAHTPRHVSAQDARTLFNHETQGLLNATWSWLTASSEQSQIQGVQSNKEQLEAHRLVELKKLYEQFELFDANTPYAPLLRDALRILLDCKAGEVVVDGEWVPGTPLVATTRHRMFKEILDHIVEQTGYETLAQEYGDFKRGLTKDSVWPNNRPEFLHMHLAQQLAKAFYSGPALQKTAQETLNQVCRDDDHRDTLFDLNLSHGQLAPSLTYERERIAEVAAAGTHSLSTMVVTSRRLSSAAKSDAFNPGSQGNISERMWTEEYVNAADDVVQRTVQLRVGTPTVGERSVTGAFKLFLDGLYADRQRVLYGSLQNSSPGHSEAGRVSLLEQLADHPRRRRAIVVLNLPMDGPFYEREGSQPLGDFLGNLSSALTNTSVDTKGRLQIDTRASQQAVYVPLEQLNELYDGEFPWNKVVKECLDEVKAQYFSQKERTQLVSPEEQRAFQLITYVRLMKKLRPMLGVDFAIEGCKDDQDRGATLKLVHAIDNLIVMNRENVEKDLLAVRLAYHRGAWFNKSFAVVGPKRGEYAEATVRLMLQAGQGQQVRRNAQVSEDIALRNMQFSCETT